MVSSARGGCSSIQVTISLWLGGLKRRLTLLLQRGKKKKCQLPNHQSSRQFELLTVLLSLWPREPQFPPTSSPFLAGFQPFSNVLFLFGFHHRGINPTLCVFRFDRVTGRSHLCRASRLPASGPCRAPTSTACRPAPTPAAAPAPSVAAAPRPRPAPAPARPARVRNRRARGKCWEVAQAGGRDRFLPSQKLN